MDPRGPHLQTSYLIEIGTFIIYLTVYPIFRKRSQKGYKVISSKGYKVKTLKKYSNGSCWIL